MKLLSTNRLKTAKHTEDITDIGFEMPAEAGGMTQKQVEAIWQACENLYRVGAYPMISMCIRRRGQVILDRAIGHTQASLNDEHNTNNRATVDTPVCLFSASKLVTAMMIHLLIERGLINIDDPVGLYIPEYAVNGKEKTTIRHLLVHQAGISHVPQPINGGELLFDNEEIFSRLCAIKPAHEPGTKTAYHALTSGYILAEVLKRVTGQDLRQFLAENVEKPLDLPFFNYGLDQKYQQSLGLNMMTGLHPKILTDKILTHVIGGDMKMAVNLTNDPRFFDIISPSANIFTSANQSTVFLQMLLNGGTYNGQQVFKPETVRRAVKESFVEFDHGLLMPMRYGLGPMLGMKPFGIFGANCKEAFGHIGFTNIFCYADPKRDIAVSILTTGKPLLGVHYPQLIKLLLAINFNCPSIARKDRTDVFV